MAPITKQNEQEPEAATTLKAFRYEDTSDGASPLLVDPQYPPVDPPSSPQRHSRRLSFLPSRSRASTGQRSENNIPALSGVSREAKRDSGVAPSIANSAAVSYTDSLRSGYNTGAAREPSLPTILVQHEESTGTMDGHRSPLGKRRSPEHRSNNQTYSIPSSPTSTLNNHHRMESFHGLDTAIPDSAFDEFDLSDLTSDKVGFSHRGSMLFGGKKMNELIASQADVPSRNPAHRLTVKSNRPGYSPMEPAFVSLDEKVRQEPASPLKSEPHTPTQGDMHNSSEASLSSQARTLQASEQPTGLRAGRRKPSVQMLQAALQGGRVLSAEEITFSLRVRSMYEAGDERAADWTTPQVLTAAPSVAGSSMDDLTRNGSNTPDTTTNGVPITKTRSANSPHSPQMRASAVRASYYNKEATELAGGIEDWGDVNSEDVDRYGFINSARSVSRASNTSGLMPEHAQRVAGSLRAESRRSRKHRSLRRMPSVAGSARSMPPRPSDDWATQRGPPSVYSSRSHAPSSRNASTIFKSKDRRVLDEASDMLTLPPGLAAIAEHEDAGKTASLQKQREWARELKWQKMARPIKSTARGKGGGMRFDFDTADPKVISRTWKGIPDRWRATAWHSFLSSSARDRHNASPASDEELIGQYHKLQEENGPDDVQIDVDVPRTVNLHIMFRRRYRGGQRLLFRVLHAVSVYFPETGYVQGMASLAATFLCYYEEEMAFVMLVRLWQLRGLEQLFSPGFGGLMAALGAFEQSWLGPAEIASRLATLGVSSTAYGTRWYLTLFNMSIPFPAQLRVWDAFMLLGDRVPVVGGGATALGEFGGADLAVLHATSAALVDATREILLDSDFENAMKVLTGFVPIRDEDLLMRVARAEYTLHKKKGDF